MEKLSIDEIINTKNIKSLLSRRIEEIQSYNIKNDIENMKSEIRDCKPFSAPDDESINENSEFLNELKDNYRFSYFENDIKNYFG
ncbi:hypothetical protein THOM_2078 [Trachipleistophora hominis]|uniref:Uncharacterized protein n=1 Tax=Trachipleistophora hominis TaxID=72359 RepID=L7JUI7_TRAHO|nr:hypothetical protein THOM_2078 [Trachipleistophora hominis]